MDKLIDKVLTVILLTALVACVSLTVYIIITPKIGERFTEFYILGPEGKAANYPTKLKLGQNGTVIIGISNHEYRTMNYTIVVKFGNVTIWEKRITLNHNETWEYPFTFKAIEKGKRIKIEFLLFVDENFTSPYRELHLWLDVS
jgi:uncharacterized membrane protein